MKRFASPSVFCFITALGSLLFGAGGYSAREVEQPVLVRTSEISAVLDPITGSVSVRPDDGRWNVDMTEVPPLWRLGWRKTKGEYREMTADARGTPCRFVGVDRKGNQVEIRWTANLDAPGDTEIRAVVEVDGNGTLRWRLEVKSGAGGWYLNDVDFPIIGGIPAEGAKLVQPHGWGLLRENLREGPTWCNYPGVFAAMQFVGLQTRDGLLYLSSEDPGGYQKIFGCIPNQSRKTLDLRVRHFPPVGEEHSTSWKTPYPTAVAVIPGATWVEAGKRYKEWTYSAPWGRCRLQYGLVPEWLAENDLWVCHEDGAVDATSISRLLSWKEAFGARSAVHWYRWHQIPHDIGYPEYFPPKAGSFEAFRRVQEAGLPIMPYINGRLWDPATDSWKAQNASAAATRDENGNIRTEVYYTKIPLAVMCPSTELWQDTVTGLVKKLARQQNVDAVYIDQIGAADALICHATNHPHPAGGGNYWTSGYREMLNRCRSELRLDQAITTEECADAWNDLIDGFLLVNTHNGLGDIIPLYPMVYGGRTVYFGFQYIANAEITQGLPFRAKMARSFVWGGQIGWIRPVILQPEHQTEADFLRELAQVQKQAHAYLQEGRMLPSPKLAGVEVVSVTAYATGGSHTDRVPAVVNGLWQSKAGAAGLALSNWTDTKQSFTIERLRYTKPPILIATDDIPRPSRKGAAWNMELPARRAVVLVWESGD